MDEGGFADEEFQVDAVEADRQLRHVAMADFQLPPTDRQVKRWLAGGGVRLPPLAIEDGQIGGLGIDPTGAIFCRRNVSDQLGPAPQPLPVTTGSQLPGIADASG